MEAPATFEAGSREAFEAEMKRRASAVADAILGGRAGKDAEEFRKELAEGLGDRLLVNVHGNWAFYETKAAAQMYFSLRAVMKESPLRRDPGIRQRFDAACAKCQQSSGDDVMPFTQWKEEQRQREDEARREEAAREARTINLEEL